MSLYVSRCPFCAVYLPSDDTADVAHGEDEACCGGTFVGACDVLGYPSPHRRYRDEPKIMIENEREWPRCSVSEGKCVHEHDEEEHDVSCDEVRRNHQDDQGSAGDGNAD